MAQCIEACFQQPGLIKGFDRLWGANLSRKGSGLELMIDDATGKAHADMGEFLEFIYEYIFLRTPTLEEY